MPRTLGDLLRLVRLPNTLGASADVLAGAALAGGSLTSFPVLLGSLGSAALYAGGMALNDLTDLEKDRRLHPERPLPAGYVSPREVKALVLLLLLAGSATALVGGGVQRLTTGALLASILAYDFLGDRLPHGGAALMGLCRGLNLARGLTLERDTFAPSLLIAVGGLFCLVLLITLISQLEEGPPRSGALRRRALWLLLPYQAPAAAGLMLFHPSPGIGVSLVLAGGLLWLYVAFPARKAHVAPAELVRRGVFTLVLFDALLALAASAPILALALGALLPVMLWLARALGQRAA